MSDIEIERQTIYEFDFELFTIVFEDDTWFVEVEDPEVDAIILEDSEGRYFQDKVQLLGYELTEEEFETLKQIVNGK